MNKQYLLPCFLLAFYLIISSAAAGMPGGFVEKKAGLYIETIELATLALARIKSSSNGFDTLQYRLSNVFYWAQQVVAGTRDLIAIKIEGTDPKNRGELRVLFCDLWVRPWLESDDSVILNSWQQVSTNDLFSPVKDSTLLKDVQWQITSWLAGLSGRTATYNVTKLVMAYQTQASPIILVKAVIAGTDNSIGVHEAWIAVNSTNSIQPANILANLRLPNQVSSLGSELIQSDADCTKFTSVILCELQNTCEADFISRRTLCVARQNR